MFQQNNLLQPIRANSARDPHLRDLTARQRDVLGQEAIEIHRMRGDSQVIKTQVMEAFTYLDGRVKRLQTIGIRRKATNTNLPPDKYMFADGLETISSVSVPNREKGVW